MRISNSAGRTRSWSLSPGAKMAPRPLTTQSTQARAFARRRAPPPTHVGFFVADRWQGVAREADDIVCLLAHRGWPDYRWQLATRL